MSAKPALQIQHAPPKPVSAAAKSFTLPAGFRMTEKGLYFDKRDNTGASSAQYVCQPFEIRGLARTAQSDGWSFVLRFRNLDGVEVERIFPRSLLAADGAELRKALLDQGFSMSMQASVRTKLVEALNAADTTHRAILAASTGWTKESFVLPGETFGPTGSEPVMLRTRTPGAHYAKAGSLEEWNAEIGDKALGNPLLLFSVALAFAPPLLLKIGSAEGGVFHIRGPSTAGKTTLARAAGSVWGGGGPLGFAQTWRGTCNAVEMMLAAHCDTLIVLDELKQSDPNEIGQVVYAITTGISKGRLNAAAELKQRVSWRTIALSTGELSLADHMRAATSQSQTYAGQELRFLDIEADAGSGCGVWLDLHGATSPKAFADALNVAADRQYGWAGPAFVQQLVTRGAHSFEAARIFRSQFERRVSRPDDPAQVRRAASRFAVVAAAGELAVRFEITGWPEGAAMDACQLVFEKWAAAFGRSGSHEERDVLRKLVDAIEKHGSTHFAPRPRGSDDTGTGPAQRSLEQWGWVETREDGERLYYLTSAGFKQVFKGIDYLLAARTLAARGHLVTPKEKGRFQKKIDVRGQKHNVYVVKGSVTDMLAE